MDSENIRKRSWKYMNRCSDNWSSNSTFGRIEYWLFCRFLALFLVDTLRILLDFHHMLLVYEGLITGFID